MRYEDAISENPAYLLSVKKPGSRNLFFSDIRRKNIDKCIRYYCSEDETILNKIQFREDRYDICQEKGIGYSILWAIKNIKRIL